MRRRCLKKRLAGGFLRRAKIRIFFGTEFKSCRADWTGRNALRQECRRAFSLWVQEMHHRVGSPKGRFLESDALRRNHRQSRRGPAAIEFGCREAKSFSADRQSLGPLRDSMAANHVSIPPLRGFVPRWDPTWPRRAPLIFEIFWKWLDFAVTGVNLVHYWASRPICLMVTRPRPETLMLR